MGRIPGWTGISVLLEDWGILNRRKFLFSRVFKYKLDVDGRDTTEYELLLRARSAMLKDGPTADPHEVARVDNGTSLFSPRDTSSSSSGTQ